MLKKLLITMMMVATMVLTSFAADTKPVEITFTWSGYLEQCPECTDYQIFFYVDTDENGPYAMIPVTDDTYTVPYIDDGLSHNYWIRAEDHGELSGNSTVITVDTWYPTPENPPLPETPEPPPDKPEGMKYRLIFENVVIEQM